MNFKILLIVFLSFLFSFVTAQKTEPVKIGLLIQDKAFLAAKLGAEMAIKMANEKGGCKGRPFQLITKSMEGPWGTGSKQAVALIFEDEVWALLGSHDGRNAHLVEQAATKSTVVYLSAWSSDPSLSQAFVPWFFNCVPNDRMQADALIEEIYNKRKITRVATINDQAYDSNIALKSYLQSLKLAGKNQPVSFLLDKDKLDLDVLADQIKKAEVNGIILFCQPSVSLKIIRSFRQGKMNLPVFGTLAVMNEDALSLQELHELDNRVFIPYATLSGSKSLVFRQDYQKTYGKMPGMVAAYAFDGMNVLIEAIRTSCSPEREQIQQGLSIIRYEGVTGLVQFDNTGNRQGYSSLSAFKKGIPYGVQ